MHVISTASKTMALSSLASKMPPCSCAHIDAKGQFSERLMFFALLEVAAKESNQRCEMLEDIQASIQQGLPQLDLDFCLDSDTQSVNGLELSASLDSSMVNVILTAANEEFIPHWVKQKSILTFDAVHKAAQEICGGATEEEIHVDSVVYITASFLLIHSMGIESITCSPFALSDFLSTGSPDNEVKQQLLVGLPISPGPSDHQQKGKSGTSYCISFLKAVVMATSSCASTNAAQFNLKRIGSAKWAEGSVTIFMGEKTLVKKNQNRLHESELWDSDTVVQMEANLDDTTGENLGYVIELLLKNGALDAWTTPITMKKGRPAQTLHVLCHETDEKVARDLLELIFRHTTTLGVRMNSTLHRAKLVRRLTQVESTNGYGTKDTVRVKISSFKTGEVVSIKPEFDDCKEISVSTGVPLESISRDVTIKILEIISSRAKNQPNK